MLCARVDSDEASSGNLRMITIRAALYGYEGRDFSMYQLTYNSSGEWAIHPENEGRCDCDGTTAFI